MALQTYGALEDVTHAFTAGGTLLKALSGAPLPFLQAMYLTQCSSAGGIP
jgi:3-phosphoglycerate kinase